MLTPRNEWEAKLFWVFEIKLTSVGDKTFEKDLSEMEKFCQISENFIVYRIIS